MAQVVIFAPPGEDVSVGEQALKDAGHEVEVVEATAANLLHMAIGMVEDGEEPKDEPAEEPPAEEEPAEELPPEEEEVADEPTTESIGKVEVDGETVNAYLDRKATFPLLYALDTVTGPKVTYSINESTFSYWKESGLPEVQLITESGMVTTQMRIHRAATSPFIVLDKATARALGLL